MTRNIVNGPRTASPSAQAENRSSDRVSRDLRVHANYTHFSVCQLGIAHYEGMTESIVLAAEYGQLIRKNDLAAV